VIVRQIGTDVYLSVTITANGIPVTGQTPTAGVRRVLDGYWYDWNDGTFKAAGWGSRMGAMSEVGTTAPGLYVRLFNPGSAIVTPAAYQVAYQWNDGSNDYGTVDDERWALGDIADKTLVNKMKVDGNTSTLIVYEADGVTPAQTWDLQDKDGNAIVLTGTGPTRRNVQVGD
jgi:hypothetical protein